MRGSWLLSPPLANPLSVLLAAGWFFENHPGQVSSALRFSGGRGGQGSPGVCRGIQGSVGICRGLQGPPQPAPLPWGLCLPVQLQVLRPRSSMNTALGAWPCCSLRQECFPQISANSVPCLGSVGAPASPKGHLRVQHHRPPPAPLSRPRYPHCRPLLVLCSNKPVISDLCIYCLPLPQVQGRLPRAESFVFYSLLVSSA